MAGEYVGTKFSAELIGGKRELENALSLIKWCREFYKMGIASPGGTIAGNISVRTKQGFLITPSGHDFSKITENELVEVVEVIEEKRVVRAIGKANPSSEAFLHAGIYEAREEVNAVLHGHNRAVTKNPEKFGIAETEKERPYGTIELRDEALKALGKNKLLQLKGHGFIAMGASMEEAGKLAKNLFEETRK